MSLTSKTTAWVQQGIISIQQQQDILAFERTHANKTFWNTAFIFSGVLIGLGVGSIFVIRYINKKRVKVVA